MYTSAPFFAVLFASSLLFSGANRVLGNRLSYASLFSAFAMFAVWGYIFKSQITIPLLMFIYLYGIATFKDKLWLKTWQSVILSLLPLILVKLHLNNHWGMLGLSFMTFRAVDVLLYRNKKDSRDFFQYFSYLFLPFIILAGPMYRWRSWVQDITQPNFRLTTDVFLQSMEQVFYGIVQKFLFAMLIDNFVISHWSHRRFTLTVGIVMSLAYSFYLYFDFAGYSNMAIGAGRLFGLNLPANFNLPILAKNPQDFWRRFHISLSEWLRDVVFMPIYMNLMKVEFFRNHKATAQNVGIFCTLFCMGAWNGLELNYVVSGALFGGISVIHNMILWFAKRSQKMNAWLKKPLIVFLGRVLTLASAAASLYIFSGMSPV
ncbi:MBOAT family O-acyltransferase [Buttiauxella selenatireducens]|uniref:Probable alginate O-acetylase AlgI n=1 Tax=Buttiauxella selenatireducens TaxID=3073902 RepID=A0ABY9SJJ9_9ENTR|nr:MBOAT family O-acyltransferase [Buttiauxella sp. R73]WMY76192.1 MBOAT family O-acyltransferase [Buttiauxella sp. R73]